MSREERHLCNIQNCLERIEEILKSINDKLEDIKWNIEHHE